MLYLKSKILKFALRASLALVVLAGSTIARAEPEKRVALVIGNGDYKSVPHLENPPIDAKAVADALKGLGFQVVEGYDLDKEHMQKIVSDFADAIQEAKAAVVYYAGHGIAVGDENYLLPVDISIKRESDLDYNAISVSLLLKRMKQEDRANVVILDACRDNPFTELRQKSRSTAAERGLSPIDGDLARGTLIAFASDPKSTAQDGPPGQHSPFTESLVAHLKDPGVPIDTVMTAVRTEVWEKTKHSQRPWVNTSLIGVFSFNPQVAPPAPPTPAPAVVASLGAAPSAASIGAEQETVLWQSADRSNLAGDYQAYLDAFPNGVFARMAKNRIANLNAAAAAGVPVRTPAVAPTPAVAATPVADAGPVAPPEKDLKAEVGTRDTENRLALTAAEKKEIQQRLTVLEFYKGPTTGEIGEMTRAAIAEWQKKRGVAATGILGPLQLQALRAESEPMFQRFLASQGYSPVASRSITIAKPTRREREPVVHHHEHAAAAPGVPNFGAFFSGVAAGVAGSTIIKNITK